MKAYETRQIWNERIYFGHVIFQDRKAFITFVFLRQIATHTEYVFEH